MANNTTGASLDPIYQRLNSAPTYHPLEAETFSDWSLEAGDMVTVSRGDEEYTSPVHVSRMVWKGKAPTMQISSTGNQHRQPVAKVSRKKYGRGSAGVRSQEQIHRNFTSEDGILHSELHVTESYLRTEFHNETMSLRSYLDMTSSHLRTEFTDEVHSLRGDFEMTVSHMHTEFVDEVNSLRGDFEVSVSHLHAEFTDEVNSLRGDFEVSVSHLHAEFTDDVNSLRSDFDLTASHLRTEFSDDVNSVRSYVHQTASSWEMRVSGVVDANGNVTAASITAAVNSGGSNIYIEASKIHLLGQTIANTIDADYIKTIIENATYINVKRLNANVVTITPISGGDAVGIQTGIRDINISLSGNTYTLQYKRFTDTSWQNVSQTFSRATSLSGQWSGRNFTVTATPQGNIKVGTVYNDIVPDTSDPVEYTTVGSNHYVARDYIVYSADENGDADTQILKKEVKISADLAYSDGYTTGYEEGAASGGTTTLSNTWNTGHLVVTANPQGETLDRWLSSGTATWNGTTVSIPINALYGNSQQYSESTGWSASVNVAGKLQSKTVSSNGTVSPDSGYIGLSSVTVSVASSDARAHFGASSGQYFIEAVDTVSGNQIPGSSVNYSLGYSGSNIVINAGSGQTTPTLALGINSGTLDTSTGSRTLTVTAGGNNTTATTTITDYSAGRSAVTVSSVAVNGTITYSSKVLTVPTLATASNSATKSVNLSVDATLAYNAGWTAYYQKWHYPTSGTGPSMSVYWPSSTADSAYDSIERKYTLENKDNNTVYLRYSSTTYAQITHGKYDAGWGAARTSTGDFPTAAVAESSRAQYITVKRPNSTVGGTASSYSYYVTSDKDKAYIRYNGTGGNIIAQYTHNQYSSGWGAARGKLSIPTSASTSDHLTIGYPPATVDGNQATYNYYVTADNSMAYIRTNNSSGTIVARASHSAYSNGYKSGFNADHTIWLVEHSCATNAVLNLSGAAHRYSIRYDYKNDNNETVEKWVGTSWEMPGVWLDYTTGEADQGTLVAGAILGLKQTNYDGTTRFLGKWQVPSGGGGTSHSITQNHAVASDLASLANALGASGSSSLTSLGTFAAAGGRNYWGIRVKCGSAIKYYYVRATT